MSLGTLTVDLMMKTGKFETDIKRAEKSAAKFAKNVDKSITKAGNVIGVGLVAAAGAVAVAFKSTVNYVDELATSAEQLGVSFKAFQELQYAAIQSDVEVSKLTTSFAKLSEKVGSLGTSSGKAFAETLASINVSAEELVALSPDKQFERIIGALADIENVNQRATAANDIFGKSFKDLNPLINQGEDGLRALRAEAEAAGAVISDQARSALTDYDNAMNKLTLTTKAAMAEAFAPLATFLTGQMDGAIAGTRSIVSLLGDELLGLTVNLQKALSGLQFYKDVYNGIADARDANKKAGFFDDQTSVFDVIGQARDAERLRDQGIDRAAEYAQQGGSQSGNGNGRGRGVNVEIRDKLNLFTPEAKGSGGKSGAAAASRALAEAQRAAEESARALADANEELNGILDAQSAEIGGPLVQAAQQYRDELIRLDEIEGEYAQQGKLTAEVQNDLNLAREQALSLYQQETEAIQNQKTPAEEDLQRMRDELKLLELSNVERAKAIYLLNNPTATQDQVKEYGDLVDSADQLAKTTQAMDEFRSSAADAFESFMDGSKSAKDAFEDFADSMVAQIARIIAQQLTESLFGGFGGSGGGEAGGFLSSLFGSLFGGGKASGGAVNPGRYYRVNENGPEVLSYQGKDFLMMGSGAGMVKQNTGSANITINLPPGSERRTAQQAAQRAGEETQRALARNR